MESWGCFGLVASGCGGNNFDVGTPVITVSSSAPGPFSSYIISLSTVTLTRDDGTVVSLVPSQAIEEVLSLTKMSDQAELMGAPAVAVGTYKSASVTLDYSTASISVDINGKPQAASVVDKSGAALSQVTVNLTFDPAHQLVIKKNVATHVNLNFDLSAASVVDASTSPIKVAVRPVVTSSTVPVQAKSIRSRGVFVTTDNNAGTFTINTKPFFDLQSQPFGALAVQTTAQTAYNINGIIYTGSAGLQVLSTLQINTLVAAYGTLGSLAGVTPGFNATQVYAGSSVEGPQEDRVSGVISARTGNQLTIHGAAIVSRSAAASFQPDLFLTVGDATAVSIDGQPGATGLGPQSISIGQQVNAGGGLVANAANTALVSLDATAGDVRLVPTPAWGTLNAGANSMSASLDLLTLGGFEPSAFNFAGTGSGAGLDAKPSTYTVDTGSIDESATAAGTLLRVDGIVSGFGKAPPDFIASDATVGTSTDQVLIIDWVSGGATAPFSSASTGGLVVNIANTHRGTAHVVQTGPASLDLTNPAVSPLIVPDATISGQFAIGNAANGVAEFNSFASFLTKISSTLNGTNALQKLVAVGRYDAATGTFTAYRIDLVQQ